ncbi:MAG: class I SAM-dependent methyltransferase [Chloroflexota bacterium]
MTEEDARRWDRKWAETDKVRTPSRLLVAHRHLLNGGIAADIACGLGQNTIWLAEIGFDVLGLDISAVALDEAVGRARDASVAHRTLFARTDLAIWPLAAESLDVLCVFRFLERDLFPRLAQTLKAGGLLFYETRHLGILDRRPDSNPDYLLDRGELARAFPDLEQLTYEEGAENARLVARRPPTGEA